MIDIATAWLKARWEERTSWNGAWLIGVGVCVVLSAPFIKWIAYAAIAWGAFQIYKKESE